MFPKIGIPQNGWFLMENPIKMDYLRVPLFLETPTWILRANTKKSLEDHESFARPAPARSAKRGFGANVLEFLLKSHRAALTVYGC